MASGFAHSCLTAQEKSGVYLKFKQLLDFDDLYCQKSQKLVWKIFSTNKGIFSKSKKTLENIIFMGSLSEGCTLPRLFGKNDIFPDGLNREVELDVDFLLIDIPKTFKSSVHDVPSKRGVAKISAKEFDVTSLAKERGWLVGQDDFDKYRDKMADKDGYLQPFHIKKHGSEKLEMNNSDRFIQLLLAAALGEKKKDITLTHQPNKVKKSAITADFILNIKHKPIIELSIDYAIVLKIKWWPELYEEFKTRKDRVWPSQDVIDELTQECHIIAKPSDEAIQDLDTREFRYSVAHIEKALIAMRSPQQKLVYEVFKILYVKFIKPEGAAGEEKLTTFLCKNTMLWVCERFQPSAFMWSPNYDSLYQAVAILFSELLNSVQCGVMPYYFDRKENIIKTMQVDTRDNVSCKIQKMLFDLDKFLGIPTTNEMSAAREILGMIEGITDVLSEIEKGDYYSRLLHQPELIPDVLAFFVDQHGPKVEREVKRVGKQIENEAKRVAPKIEREVKKVGTQIEDEVKRATPKVEREAHRVGKQIENEAKRFEKRLRKFRL